MVELADLKAEAGDWWRKPVLFVLICCAMAAFYWAIDDLPGGRSHDPVIVLIRTIGFWIYGIVFVAWFTLGFLDLIKEWRGPVGQVVAASRLQIGLRRLTAALGPGMMMLIYLPALASLAEHHATLRLSAAAPAMAFGVCWLAAGVWSLIRDWRVDVAAA